MTTPDEPRRETLAEVQRLLARARPEQLCRLLADIRAADRIPDRDNASAPQRRVS
ncbi:hypothetical protein SAMN05443999_108127 [Roseovarius azorensis]|uniref:Uncharacterized protein n=1 Tax=Roseovarius azorensis TaxID=1287727 RepID=A0A1H7TF32_9RHOB|nr:hypothetical protein [Roseovarius azorensis]SEL82457.1 hypothetical protein SAMN05443999_108127 [Roseovarius azorensis]